MNENKTRTYRLRMVIALAVIAVVAVGYFAAGGIGNICGIGFESLTLLCPLGALMALLAEKTAIPVAVISVVAVLAICIALGKVFCSWVCPVHFLAGPKRRRELAACEGAATRDAKSEASPVGGDLGCPSPTATKPLSKKEKKALSGCTSCTTPCGKSGGVKIDSRHGILAAALGSTLLFGFPVFCLVCPVGLTFATVLLVMRLFAFGETTWTIIVFIALIAAEVILLPRWCAKFCPLGALLSLMSGLNRTFRPHLNAEKCLVESRGASCDLCVHACPEGINLHDIAAGETTLADCSKCRACADVCPTGAITFPLLAPKSARAGARAAAASPAPDAVSDLDENLAFAGASPNEKE